MTNKAGKNAKKLILSGCFRILVQIHVLEADNAAQARTAGLLAMSTYIDYSKIHTKTELLQETLLNAQKRKVSTMRKKSIKIIRK